MYRICAPDTYLCMCTPGHSPGTRVSISYGEVCARYVRVVRPAASAKTAGGVYVYVYVSPPTLPQASVSGTGVATGIRLDHVHDTDDDVATGIRRRRGRALGSDRGTDIA